MNTTRIEVPLLPPPQFDDERTIATARRVEPIGRAKVTESWRKVRTLLPLLLLATICGGLGAAGVNYYERRHSAEATTATQPLVNNVPVQAKIQPSPVDVAASAEVNGSQPSETESSPAKPDETSAKTDKQVVQTDNNPTRDEQKISENAASSADKKTSDADAAKITRKRRVQPADEPTPPAKKNGAGRIADIFSGPNP